MMLSLTIPDIANKPKNTKDAVVSILTTDWPLTAREIFYKIRKRFNYGSSYQSVYKAVKELLDDEVLISKGRKYELSIGWVKKLQSFTDIIETNYYAKERMHDLTGIKDSKHRQNIMVLNFHTIFDTEKYLYYFMKAELMKINNDTICHIANNEWRPIFYLRAEYNYYRKLMQRGHRFYFVSRGKSQIEQGCAKLYREFGVNFRQTDEASVTDILVFSDYFINIHIPEELKSKMKSCLDRKEIIRLVKEVLDKESEIRVIITKDKAIANQIKSQTLKSFKR